MWVVSILDELQAWLAKPEHSYIQVVMLQETHWRFNGEWQNSSILGLPACRLYTAKVWGSTHTRLCHSRQLRSREVYPGRMLHTRIPVPGADNSLDILNVYQFPWGYNQSHQITELRQKRYQLLQRMEETIRALPQHNIVVCGGDMSVQLTPQPGLVGNSTSRPRRMWSCC